MKKILIYSFLVATITIMSGCGAFRQYSNITDVDSTLFGNQIATDTTSIASIAWRDFFNDTCLQHLIDTALVRNTDINIAHLRVEQASAQLLNARLAYLPAIGIGIDGTASRWNGTETKTYSIGGNASWEIDAFGKLTAAKRGAKASFDEIVAYEQAIHTGIIASVASSYYTLLMLDSQIKIAEQTLDNWHRTVTTLRSLMAAGRTNEAAVLQASANESTLEANLMSLRKSLNEAQNAMCILLAMPPQTINRSRIDDQYFTDTLSIGVPIQLLANRPDVRQAEAALAKAFYATGMARAAFYPSINLSGIIGWTNSGGGVIINPGKWLLNAIGSITQPLFNRGNNIANLRITKAQQEIASLTFQQRLIEAGNEVNNAVTAIQTARQRIALNTQSVESLQEALHKTELLMRYSSVNYLEVLTAQHTLLQAQQSLVHDRFDEINSIITLYHALGGGQ